MKTFSDPLHFSRIIPEIPVDPPAQIVHIFAPSDFTIAARSAGRIPSRSMHNIFLKQNSKSLPRMKHRWRKLTGILICLFSISASGMSADFTDEQLQALSKDPKSVKAGSKMFQTSCASCHLASNYLSDKDKPAMNLKDGIWYYGGKPTEIFHSISIGNPVKNMTAFGNLLLPSEVAELVAYLLTIQTPADASQPGATAPTSPTPAN